jgi:hypothetical protein
MYGAQCKARGRPRLFCLGIPKRGSYKLIDLTMHLNWKAAANILAVSIVARVGQGKTFRDACEEILRVARILAS